MTKWWLLARDTVCDVERARRTAQQTASLDLLRRATNPNPGSTRTRVRRIFRRRCTFLHRFTRSTMAKSTTCGPNARSNSRTCQGRWQIQGTDAIDPKLRRSRGSIHDRAQGRRRYTFELYTFTEEHREPRQEPHRARERRKRYDRSRAVGLQQRRNADVRRDLRGPSEPTNCHRPQTSQHDFPTTALTARSHLPATCRMHRYPHRSSRAPRRSSGVRL